MDHPVPPPPASEESWFVQASSPSYLEEAQRGAPPDVVLTNDGGMLRGTIVRSQPGRSVQIQLPTGETTEVPWANVRFAGPANEAPAVAPPTTAPPPPSTITASPGISVDGGREVRIEFASDQRLTLHNVGATATGSASVTGSWIRVNARSDRWDRLCSAPCELHIQPGDYRFGVSIDGRGPFPGGLVHIARPGRLYGHYVDHSGLRAGGWAVFLAGGLLGGGAIFAAAWLIFGAFWEGVIAGGANLLLGVLVGAPMMAAGNGVVFRFE